MSLVSLSVNYHQQDNDFCCGPSCAQMLLVSKVKRGPYLGRELDGLPNERYQQTYSNQGIHAAVFDVTSVTFGAGTHPEALKQVLNNRRKKPAYKDIIFRVYAFPDRGDIICRIVHTLEEHSIAPVVLVNGGQHWVSVTGCNYNVGPGTTNVEIIDFTVQDPSPASLPGASKLHSKNDGCGTGQFGGNPSAQFICSSWLSGYMNQPVPGSFDTNEGPVDTGDLEDCYVAVCASYLPEDDPRNDAKYTSFTCG